MSNVCALYICSARQGNADWRNIRRNAPSWGPGSEAGRARPHSWRHSSRWCLGLACASALNQPVRRWIESTHRGVSVQTYSVLLQEYHVEAASADICGLALSAIELHSASGCRPLLPETISCPRSRLVSFLGWHRRELWATIRGVDRSGQVKIEAGRAAKKNGGDQ